MSIHSFARDTVSRPPTYDDAPAPLSDNERKLLQRMFSDYFEVPGEWKTALKADLERDPPILGKSTLGGQSAVLAPNSVYSVHIFDGTIVDADVNALNKDGAQNVPSMRTLGTGHQQAAAGDDPRFSTIGQAEAWWSGSGVPAGTLGATGDWYLNTVNGDVYEKTAVSTWTLRANIKGPQGAQGPVGPPGESNAAYNGTWNWQNTGDASASGRVSTDQPSAWFSSTELRLNETTAPGTDASAYFAKIKAGDAFRVELKSDASTYIKVNVTAVGTDHGTWWSWPVTFVTGQGSPPSNNTPMLVTLLTTGPQAEEWIGGAGAPAGTLGNVGDWYLDQTSGDVYEKTGSTTWTLRTNIKGPTGATGATGAQGPQGTTGSQGPQGNPGTPGATGSQGPAGAPGSIWRSGTGAPAGSLGIVGDWYENDANGDIYEKTGASAYTLRDNLTGPQGAQGAQGIQGPQGPQGVSGASTFVSGTGAPTAGVGVDGSLYLDTASLRFWGPKAAGAWPATAFGRVMPLAPTYAQMKTG